MIHLKLMKFFRIALLIESVSLLLLASALFRLQHIPELAVADVPIVSAIIKPEIQASTLPNTTPTEPEPWSMLAVGDVMLDRYVRTVVKTKGVDYPFATIKPLLAGHDIVLGNLEGPF